MALVVVDGIFEIELITLMVFFNLTREVNKSWGKEVLGEASQPNAYEFVLGQASAGSHQTAPHRSHQPLQGPPSLTGQNSVVSAQLGVTHLGSSSQAAAPGCLLTLPTSAPCTPSPW